MTTFSKEKSFLYRYIIGLVITLALLGGWIYTLIKFPGSKVGDIILLSLFFTILLLGEGLFIGVYLIRPSIVLSIDADNIYIHLTKKKTKIIPFVNVTSIGNIRKSAVIVTKDYEMTTVRFLGAKSGAEEALREGLNQYISVKPELYFQKDDLISKKTAENE